MFPDNARRSKTAILGILLAVILLALVVRHAVVPVSPLEQAAADFDGLRYKLLFQHAVPMHCGTHRTGIFALQLQRVHALIIASILNAPPPAETAELIGYVDLLRRLCADDVVGPDDCETFISTVSSKLPLDTP